MESITCIDGVGGAKLLAGIVCPMFWDRNEFGIVDGEKKIVFMEHSKSGEDWEEARWEMYNMSQILFAVWIY